MSKLFIKPTRFLRSLKRLVLRLAALAGDMICGRREYKCRYYGKWYPRQTWLDAYWKLNCLCERDGYAKYAAGDGVFKKAPRPPYWRKPENKPELTDAPAKTQNNKEARNG